MAEVYAIRLLDALDGAGPHTRSHDGKHLIPVGSQVMPDDLVPGDG